MKVIGITSTAVLSLILGITASAYAQPYSQQGEHEKQDRQGENKHDQAQPEKQHGQEQGQGDRKQQPSPAKQQPARPERQTQKAQPQNQPDRNRQQGQAGRQPKPSQSQPEPQRAEQGKRPEQKSHQVHVASQPSHQQRQRTPEQQRVQQAAWQQHRSERWESDHHTWQQRGGYNGYRIPDARYSGYFGSEHGFRIYGRPFLVVGGFPRFQYRGYWFSLVDPWPQYWSNDWYDTDEVYVSYIDNGYYLFDRSHPEAGIAIKISL